MVRSADPEDRISILSRRLVPDQMWALVQPLIPMPRARPQGGGRTRVDNRAVFVAIVFVLTSGCAWRRLPVTFGIAVPTAYRRFVEWNGVRLWERLSEAVYGAIGDGDHSGLADLYLLEWAQTIRDAAAAREAFTS